MSLVLSLACGVTGWVGHNVCEKVDALEDAVLGPKIGKRALRILTNIFAGASAGGMLLLALSTTRFAIKSFALMQGMYALAIAVSVIAALNNRYETEIHLTRFLNITALVASVGAVAFGALSLVGMGGVAIAVNSLILLHDLYDRQEANF